MALRKLISNAILPNFEKDISRVMKLNMEQVAPMLDSMMVPQAYGFTSQGASAGAFQSSALRASPAVKKVNVPIKQGGLFH